MNLQEAKEYAKKNIQNRPKTQGRLGGKIAIVTGGAQGFGLGIATEMYKEGATVVLADLNIDLANESAKKLGERAIGLKVDVSSLQSVEALVATTVEKLGGIDIFVSNAGVAISGSLADIPPAKFEFVTKVNYLGFYYCAKAVSEIMIAQHEADPDQWFDIIQINSKSGLTGSKNNSAYAGSKFGGVGLTQSFALEFVGYNIKVNAICPGNFYDGPLWSDPEKGLFIQYLNSGKVSGAKSVEDVKEYYLSKSPIHRGCTPVDVSKALFYCVEQCYETGQAIPVTGGQTMLN